MTPRSRLPFWFRLPSAAILRWVLLSATSGLLGGSAAPVMGQAHYWSEHFGNESLLLNGAVIGSVADAGAVFYNPARLPHQEEAPLLSSARAWEWTGVTVEDGLGPGEDLQTSRFRGVPGFVVGSFSVPGLDDHHFAYGILTRHRTRFGFSVREDRRSVLPSLPDPDVFVGFTDFSTDFTDEWLGVSWAHRVTESLSVGASAFYFERDFARQATVDFRAAGPQGDALALQESRAYRTTDRGLVGKAGLAWRRGAVTLGLTGTLPYWVIMSEGEVRLDDFAVAPTDSAGGGGSDLRSLFQADLPVDWRTPWAIGAGVGWVEGVWQLHASAEYYAAVPRHTVLRTNQDAERVSTGDPIHYEVVDERRPVLNVGVGAQWNGSERVSLYGSLATNFSSVPDSVVDFTRMTSTTNQTTHQTDFVLLGFGLTVRTPWTDVTLGATWQGGSDEQPRVATLPDDDSNPDPGGAALKYHQWRLLAGFTLPSLGDLLPDGGGA